MNKLSRKLMISVFTLVLTFVALGATTFAWISLGTTAKVEDFDVEMKGSEGLEISLGDTKQWYSTINSTVINNYIKFLFEEAGGVVDPLDSDWKIKLDAVTSNDGKTFKGYEFGTNTLTHSNDAVANIDFLQIPIKLRTKTAKSIILNELSVASTLTPWKSDQKFTLAAGTTQVDIDDEIDGNLSDALRVSLDFVDVTPKVLVFENGETTTNTTGTLAQDVDDKYIGGFEYFAIKSGYGQAGAITLSPASGWTPKPATGNFGTGTLGTLLSAVDTSVSDYRVLDLTLNIWFEGYDNEAFNYLLGQALKISLGFELV